MRAVIKAQACARRWLAVKRYRQMRSQQRVYAALQHLLVEISHAQPGARHRSENVYLEGLESLKNVRTVCSISRACSLLLLLSIGDAKDSEPIATTS